MSAADVLTIHQNLALLKHLLSPMKTGCPRYVVVSGDQPTHRMNVKIWRNCYLQSVRGSLSESMDEDLRVHKSVITFPGLFHIEKQSLYPLCKEMLHGIGLEELAACSGL